MSSLSFTSVIRSFVFVLSAVSYVTAQIPMGVEMVPNPAMSGSQSDPAPSNPPSSSSSGSISLSSSYSGSSPSSQLPVETGTPAYGAPPSQYTSPPAESPGGYKPMPYSSFADGGYSQMDCGYGYKKGYDGKCTPESWWGDNNSWGCYQTTIIVNKADGKPHCSPPSTVTVTDKSVETKMLTVTYTQPIPTTIYNTVTKTDVKVETLYVTNTQTLPVTITSTSLSVDPTTLTKTDTIKEILTEVVTQTDTKVVPTTYTSIWVKTDIIDKTNTVEHTLTSTVVNEKTLINTLTYLSTATKTDISTQLSVSTSVTTQIVQESSLANCLSQCDKYKSLKPGNGDQWNTYASPPAHTPSPTNQPYQYQLQDGKYY